MFGVLAEDKVTVGDFEVANQVNYSFIPSLKFYIGCHLSNFVPYFWNRYSWRQQENLALPFWLQNLMESLDLGSKKSL